MPSSSETATTTTNTSLKAGIFMMPAHAPDRPLAEAQNWDLSVLTAADRMGFSEGWVGEHFTSPWEPNPAPDLLLAQAFRETENIKLGPGTHLVPFHHPAELALRLAYMDHLSGGRLQVGLGPGSVPSDHATFGVDGKSGQHLEMFHEGLEIILKYWNEREPWRFEGKYWTCERVARDFMADGRLGQFLEPMQTPHPRIAMAGASPNSETLRMCGRRGFIPLSLNMHPRFVSQHFDTFAAGAAEGGRVADRRDWRILKEVFVAETDAEARKLATSGFVERFFNEFWLPIYGKNGRLLSMHKHDDSVADEDVTLDYLIDTSWIVGSVETAIDKLQALYDQSGGFGTIMMLSRDYQDAPEAWFNSMELFINEVLPKIKTHDGEPIQVSTDPSDAALAGAGES